ncbi:helix-turn-helix domain-containing protein [Acuticoccus sp.]|uniref:helix-turn-helix domain-containing protein n=1 Tax=Acuticoccus sp. TaxID=1904378 RepID=UPI003B51E73F
MEQRGAMVSRKQPNPIDVHVGSRLKLRRAVVGMTQEKLGDQLGVTFQQVQKYEKGANRIGASRLQEIAQILTVPVSYFFEDAKAAVAAGGHAEREFDYGFAEDQSVAFELSRSSPGEAHALAKAFSRIADARIRRRIIDLVETLADGQPL